MSVTFTTTIQKHLGYGASQQDSREPLGVWHNTAQVIGDATGGAAGLQYSFGAETVFSIQGIRMSSDGAESDAQILWQPGWIETGGFLWNVQMEPSTGGLGRVRRLNGDLFKEFPHTWKTATSPFPLLILEWQNVNTITFFSLVWGYYWDLKSLLLPGGPRRPIMGF